MDLLKLVESDSSFQYVMVLADYVTRFVVLCPLRGTTPIKFADAIALHWILVFGPHC